MVNAVIWSIQMPLLTLSYYFLLLTARLQTLLGGRLLRPTYPGERD
jgi:hypothetical protein